MKKLLYILFVGIAFGGCRMEPEGAGVTNVNLLSGTYTDCLGTKSAVIKDEEEMYVVRSVGGMHYLIEHQSATFNCCLPEGIAFQVEMSNDTLYFADYEKVAGNCKCICKYNTSAEIGEIEEGSYLLYLTTGEEFVGSIQLNFKPDMYEEIPVLDLIESL